MVTTIQISEKTLDILKKIREETRSSSYDEAINKVITSNLGRDSLAGYLGKKPSKNLLKDLRDEDDRF